MDFIFDEEIIELFNKYEILGVYIYMSKIENTYFGDIDKYADEVDNEFLYKWVNTHLEYFENKFKKINNIIIHGNLITNNNAENIINSLKNKKVFLTGFFDNPDIMEYLIGLDNFYFYNIYEMKLNEQSKQLYNKAINNGKVIEKKWNDEINRDEYIIVNNNSYKNDISNSDQTNNEETEDEFIILDNPSKSDIDNLVVKINSNSNKKYVVVTYIDKFIYLYHYNYDDLISKIDLSNVEFVFDIDKAFESNLPIGDMHCLRNLEDHYKIRLYDNYFNSLEAVWSFKRTIKYILDKIPDNATEIEKIVYVCNFIKQYLNYDDVNYGNIDGQNMDLSDNMFFSKGVCRHYADLITFMLKQLGINSESIGSDTFKYQEYIDNNIEIQRDSNGRVLDEELIGHRFNIIYLDNQPYWLDLTWMEQDENFYNSNQFLVSSEEFKKTHSDFVEVFKHECSNNYDRERIYNSEKNVYNWNTVDENARMQGITGVPSKITDNNEELFKPKLR